MLSSDSDSTSEDFDDSDPDYGRCSVCKKRRYIRAVVLDGKPAKICRRSCNARGWEPAMPIPTVGVWQVLRYKQGMKLPESKRYTTRQIAHLGCHLINHADDAVMLFVVFEASISPVLWPNLVVDAKRIRAMRHEDAVFTYHSEWVSHAYHLWSWCCAILSRLNYYRDATEFILNPGVKETDEINVLRAETASSALTDASMPTVLRSLIHQYAFEASLPELDEQLIAAKVRLASAKADIGRIKQAINNRTVDLLKGANEIGAELWSQHPEPKLPSVAKKRKANAAAVSSASASASDASTPKSKRAKTLKK